MKQPDNKLHWSIDYLLRNGVFPDQFVFKLITLLITRADYCEQKAIQDKTSYQFALDWQQAIKNASVTEKHYRDFFHAEYSLDMHREGPISPNEDIVLELPFYRMN